MKTFQQLLNQTEKRLEKKRQEEIQAHAAFWLAYVNQVFCNVHVAVAYAILGIVEPLDFKLMLSSSWEEIDGALKKPSDDARIFACWPDLVSNDRSIPDEMPSVITRLYACEFYFNHLNRHPEKFTPLVDFRIQRAILDIEDYLDFCLKDFGYAMSEHDRKEAIRKTKAEKKAKWYAIAEKESKTIPSGLPIYIAADILSKSVMKLESAAPGDVRAYVRFLKEKQYLSKKKNLFTHLPKKKPTKK